MMQKKKAVVPNTKALLNQWITGPISDKILTPGHGRGILCMSLLGDTLVTGSSDHGLRVYNMETGEFRRELFNKKYGHHEWVTTCAHLKDGRLLSGGMDSLLCLWDKSIVKCENLMGHGGSISKVMVDEYNIGISASYDCTMIIWDLNNFSNAQQLSGPHKNAILDFDWHNSLLVSGDKNGVVALWDINQAKEIKTIRSHHGPISTIYLYSDGTDNHLIVSAGVNDGMVCIHDMRTNKLIYNEQLHKGAINAVKSSMSNFLITGSADKTVKVLDILSGFKLFNTMQTSDAVFSLETVYNLTVAGCGDGNIVVFDNDNGECLYGFGAMSKGGVRCLKTNDSLTRLVCAGDDENALLLNYA